MRKHIKDVLIERDGISESEADEIVFELSNRMHELIRIGRIGEAQEVCADYGLEPDYIMDLI